MAENMDWPDQPDGIDMDSHDLPNAEAASSRVTLFLEWYGDGRVETLQDGPRPLYARDLWALANAVPELLWLLAEAAHWRDFESAAAESAEEDNRRLRVENARLRREVEFEATGMNPSRLMLEVVKPSLRAEIERLRARDAGEPDPQSLCACVSDEQAAVLREGGFARTQCAVHPVHTPGPWDGGVQYCDIASCRLVWPCPNASESGAGLPYGGEQ